MTKQSSNTLRDIGIGAAIGTRMGGPGRPVVAGLGEGLGEELTKRGGRSRHVPDRSPSSARHRQAGARHQTRPKRAKLANADTLHRGLSRPRTGP
jgi:hypothetical protein